MFQARLDRIRNMQARHMRLDFYCSFKAHSFFDLLPFSQNVSLRKARGPSGPVVRRARGMVKQLLNMPRRSGSEEGIYLLGFLVLKIVRTENSIHLRVGSLPVNESVNQWLRKIEYFELV